MPSTRRGRPARWIGKAKHWGFPGGAPGAGLELTAHPEIAVLEGDDPGAVRRSRRGRIRALQLLVAIVVVVGVAVAVAVGTGLLSDDAVVTDSAPGASH